MQFWKSHFSYLIKLWSFFSKKQKRKTYLLLTLIQISSILEMFSIGLVIPFLSAITNPDLILTNKFFLFLSIDNLISSQDIPMIAGLTFICIMTISNIFRVAVYKYSVYFSQMVGNSFSELAYSKIITQQYIFYSENNSGRLINILNNKVSIIPNIVFTIVSIFSSVISIASIALVLSYINWKIFISIIFIFLFIYFPILLFYQNRIKINGKIVSNYGDSLQKLLQESFSGVREIILSNNSEIYISEYKKIDYKLRNSHANNQYYAGFPRYLVEGILIIFLVLSALMLNDSDGNFLLAIPVLGAFILAAQRALPVVQQIYAGYFLLIGWLSMMEDVIKVLVLPPSKISQHKKTKSCDSIEFRSLILEDLSFGHRQERNILNKINIKINAGDRIGIIGETGSGKSTLIDIMAGLLAPNFGRLLVNDAQISEENASEWYSNIAYVPQDIFMLDASISENIAFGVPFNLIDSDLIIEVANKSKIIEFVTRLPEGFNTLVGERGVRLSGGQRQRIAIARALYKNAAFLMLDEATSALDAETEAEIMSTLNDLGVSVTVVMVAHRLSTLSHCTKIMRLINGNLEQVGSYSDLIQITS